MNSNELMKDLVTVLKESGWLDKANEFYQEHPEYFSPSKYGGFVSNLNLSVSYQPESLADVKDVKPFVSVSMGSSIADFYREYHQYKSGSTASRTWVNGHIVTEVRQCIEQNQSSAKL